MQIPRIAIAIVALVAAILVGGPGGTSYASARGSSTTGVQQVEPFDNPVPIILARDVEPFDKPIGR